jgi:hypothetical protein
MTRLAKKCTQNLVILTALALASAGSMAGSVAGDSRIPNSRNDTVDKDSSFNNYLMGVGAIEAVANLYSPPYGTALYRSLGTSCVLLPKASTAWANVFGSDIALTTSAATSLIEVNFSSQASISDGPTDGRVYFHCSMSQDNGGTWTECSGQNSSNTGVILARRVKDCRDASCTTPTYQISTNPGTYIGYVAAQPATATLLKLEVKNQKSDGVADSAVCYPNLIVRY